MLYGNFTRSGPRPVLTSVLELDRYCPSYDEAYEWHVPGTSFHQGNMRSLRIGDSVRLELVPEAGNPYDAWAVAVDVDGHRIGYLSSGTARIWHDVVAALNKQGAAVTVPGTVTVGWDETDDTRGVLTAVPDMDDACDLASLAGLRAQHEAVVAQLTAVERAQMVDDCWRDYSNSLLRRLFALAGHAPDFRWGPKDLGEFEARVPFWHYSFVRADIYAHERRQKLMREIRRLARRAIKARERAIRLEEQEAAKVHRSEQRDVARELNAEGRTNSEVARVLQVSPGVVASLLREAGVQPQEPARVNDDKSRERVQRALRAAELRSDGLDRRAIGIVLGCGPDSAKELISDGKFYKVPEEDPERYALATLCATLRSSGMVKAKVLAALGVPGGSGLRAYRDSQALAIIGAGA